MLEKIYARDVNVTVNSAASSSDPAALWNSYLTALLRKSGYVPLADINPQLAASEPESPLNLDAIYTALLTVSPEEHERLLKHEDLRENRKSAFEQMNENRYLVLLGGPGSGKSTFVNFVAMCLCGERLKYQDINLTLLRTPLPQKDQEEQQQPLQPWAHGELLPVRVILRDFAAWLPQDAQRITGKHLWQFIAHGLEDDGIGELAPHLKEHLHHHGGLLLLDGLDEVPDTERMRPVIKQAVEHCTGLFPYCRILVTSRTYAYQHRPWKLSGFAETVLSTFTDRQIEVFVKHWYAFIAGFRNMEHAEPGRRAAALSEKILHNERLRDLAQRPLLLTLMTSLDASSGRLPEKRLELYKETVALLLLRWEWQKRTRRDAHGALTTTSYSLLEWLEVDRDKILRLLGRLAYEAHESHTGDQSRTANIEEHKLVMGLRTLSKAKHLNQNDLEDHLRDRAGLLVSPDEGIYTFPHRSFQEYLAACHLTEDNYPRKLANLFRHEPNRWREVLLLAAAKVAQGSSSGLWPLMKELCWRDVSAQDTQEEHIADAWGALLSGQIVREIFDRDDISRCYQHEIGLIRRWLEAILTEAAPLNDAPFPATERALAGNILAELGDERKGVGPENGLPDILWCEVPEGVFPMGSDPHKDKLTRKNEQLHTVHLSAFRISRYPVTNAQYQSFVTDGGYTKTWRECWSKEGWMWKEEKAQQGPNTWGGEFDLPNHPVVMVSWYEAEAFCRWLTLRLREAGFLSEQQEIRLPTEAEWEKAARGDDGRIYPWGDERITSEHANYSETGLGMTTTVGCFSKGTSPYGCEDMAGNVWEWCLDQCEYDKKEYDVVTDTYKDGIVDPVCTSGSHRVIRGGAWNLVAEDCRSAVRALGRPGYRYPDFGFRLLRT